jgi:putative Mn2+ efflux pump MntP
MGTFSAIPPLFGIAATAELLWYCKSRQASPQEDAETAKAVRIALMPLAAAFLLTSLVDLLALVSLPWAINLSLLAALVIGLVSVVVISISRMLKPALRSWKLGYAALLGAIVMAGMGATSIVVSTVSVNIILPHSGVPL